MTKSLKFIENEIEKLEQCLMINKTHSVLNYKLKYLQQIKEELEALEICKNDPAIIYTLKTLAKGESINWHRLSEEQQEKLKKVVEIN